MVKIQSETVSLKAAEVHFLEAGEPENKTIVLLHGMKFNAETWQSLGTLELLAANGYHAVAVEMPGFGKSPASDVKPGMVLEEFLNKKNIESALFIGPSMGGQISLEFCLDYPHLVSGLILLGPVGVEGNSARLTDIKVPTLAIWGENDAISPHSNANIIESNVKGSNVIIFSGASHPCYLDETAKWHEELTNFLNLQA